MTRVVNALKAAGGVSEVKVEGDGSNLTLSVRFDSRRTNAKIIGSAAKRALESDPHNRAAVKVSYEKG